MKKKNKEKKILDIHERVLAVKRALVSAGVPESSIQGCSAHEIEALEKRHNVQLPASYRSFLAVMGKCAGPLFDDIDIFIDDVDEIIQEAKTILNLGETQIPESAFVFSCRLGDIFVFFDLAGTSDDPPVYRFTTGRPGYEKIWPSFTSVLEENCKLTLKSEFCQIGYQAQQKYTEPLYRLMALMHSRTKDAMEARDYERLGEIISLNSLLSDLCRKMNNPNDDDDLDKLIAKGREIIIIVKDYSNKFDLLLNQMKPKKK